MHKTPVPILALALVLAAPAGITSGAEQGAGHILAEQPDGVVRRVLGGDVVVLDEPDDRYVRALLVFDRPIGRVSELLQQVDRQGEFRSAVKQSVTLSVFDGGALERQEMKYAFFEVVAHLRYTFDDSGHFIRWALDDRFENDLRRAEGFWELYALGGRTLARFGSLVDVGAPAPRFIQRHATRGDVQRVQRWVNSDGTWRP